MRTNRRRNQTGGAFMQLSLIFVVVAVAAVFSGYLGTKYVISPFFLGGEGKILAGQSEKTQKEETISDEKGEKIDLKGQDKMPDQTSSADQSNQTDGQDVTVYTLKFGTYSTEENANHAVANLELKSIYSYPVEIEGEYRIYSLPFCEKEDATTFKDGYLAMGEDCFVVPRSFTLKEGYSSEFFKDYVDVLRDISQGTYTGVQRQQMAVNILAELKSVYGSENSQISTMVDKTAEEAALITGTDNEILFQLQKVIIMNMSSALV